MAAAERDGPIAAVHIAVTMRSEFLGECARFSVWPRPSIAPSTSCLAWIATALLRAIRRPALLCGGEVSLDLAERLIADAGGREDELPLIQHGLMYIWNNAVAKARWGEKIILPPSPLEEAGNLAVSCRAMPMRSSMRPHPIRSADTRSSACFVR